MLGPELVDLAGALREADGKLLALGGCVVPAGTQRGEFSRVVTTPSSALRERGGVTGVPFLRPNGSPGSGSSSRTRAAGGEGALGMLTAALACWATAAGPRAAA